MSGARAPDGAPAVGLADAATPGERLSRLNDRQRDAVTHGEGPLLIVAGAGTGKTEVLTQRIAWLINSRRARPEEILALTFTEKAAAEMEFRVDREVPYGYVGATISTFHAFGDRLVREFGIELGLTRDLRVCTRAEVLVFLREHLFDLGLERYLPLGDPTRHLGALLALFDRARDEDITPEQYRAFAEQLAREAGDDAERRDRAESELEKARVYARYTRLMLEAGRVDFSDQLALALRLMRERPHLLRQLRDRYRWILVDEFQDTNHVQFEIVKLLAGVPGAGPAAAPPSGSANLTVVGDDDQSIYGFRGAKVANLMAFLDTYPGAREVVLHWNYRSRQNMLDAAHRLIRNNDPDRLEAQRGYDKRLRAALPGPGVLERIECATASDEADAVVARIAADLEAGARRPGDFAILARAHDHLTPFLAALKAKGIPFHQTGNRGLYGREEVRLCLSMLRVIADPDDSLSTFHLLGSPLFGADPEDLARLASLARRRNLSLRRLVQELDPAVLGFAPAASTREAAARFVELARQLAEPAARRPTSEVLYTFVHASGFLGQLTAEESLEAEEKVRNLSKLLGITQRIGGLLEHDRVGFFIRHLDLLIEAGDDPAAAEVDVELDAVHVLTAHNAKGLEFPVVFLVSVVEERFPARGRGEPLPLPPELVRGAPPGNARLEEERRLFYVGMTRAREALVLTWAFDYGGKIRHKMSRFAAEALDLPPAPPGRRRLDPRQAIERHAPPVEAPAGTRAPVRDDEPLRLSSSRIDDYLTCPLKYRYAHEVQVPLARAPGFMYGDAMHHAIRHFYKARLLGHPVDADEVVKVFEEAWSSEGFISREHEERRLEQGRRTLRGFVRREADARTRPLQIEQAFKFRRGNNVIEGRWDRIDERGGGIVVVDFKTAEVDEPEQADQRARRSLGEGQLGLYALAYRETRAVTPWAVELQFVESGVAGSARVEEQHLVAAAERIDRAAAGIRAADLAARPEYTACRQCPYDSFCPYTATRGAS